MIKKFQPATLNTEREFFSRGVQLIAGVDEVGRGSLAGPVSVGVALVPATEELVIEDLIDSKTLSKARRLTMIKEINDWCRTAVGHCSPEEIDGLGMTLALRLACQRALSSIQQERRPDMVLLDGKHDWLTPDPPDLLSGLSSTDALYETLVHEAWGESLPWEGPVRTVIKGDLLCASIAAASVVAKVERDHMMDQLALDYPEYGWAKNKGYGSVAHRQAIAELGPTAVHRLSWNLGASPEQVHTAMLSRMER